MREAGSTIAGSAYDQLFAALAHPTRRQILIALYFGGGAMGAGDVARMFEHTWQTTSRHLVALEDAGLVSTERSGRTKTYRLERRRLQVGEAWLHWFSVPLDKHRPPQERSHD